MTVSQMRRPKVELTCPRWYSLYTWSQNSMQGLTSRAHPLHHAGLSSVQSLSRVWLFATPWTAACQSSLSITTPKPCSNLCPSSQWCHPTISSSVIPFSSCLQSFPASGSFPVSQFFESGSKVLELQLQCLLSALTYCLIKPLSWDFPGGTVAKALPFQWRECRFDSWSGN